ncbi:hypothetical protein BDV41DRAFT_551147, partial [Aspergillus transmontanensis]
MWGEKKFWASLCLCLCHGFFFAAFSFSFLFVEWRFSLVYLFPNFCLGECGFLV